MGKGVVNLNPHKNIKMFLSIYNILMLNLEACPLYTETQYAIDVHEF